jgi:thermolysin
VGIVNKAAYLISEGGTFHGVTVSAGIGREKLAKLYTAAIRKLSKGSNVSFQQWRGLLMGEAENLFGKDSPETKAVEAAFRAVGIA